MSAFTVKIEIEDTEVQRLFAELNRRGLNQRPLMQEIGEILIESTKRRFEASTAPDGTRWAPNARTTIESAIGKFASSFTKGKINARGVGRALSKKPLIGETGELSSQIFYDASSNEVRVGSSKEYAAAHQFGNPNNRMFGRALAPIPARPFLGISSDDSTMIRDAAARFLEGSAQ